MPARWIASPARGSCSVGVVVPTSGWGMVAKVRRGSLGNWDSVCRGSGGQQIVGDGALRRRRDSGPNATGCKVILII